MNLPKVNAYHAPSTKGWTDKVHKRIVNKRERYSVRVYLFHVLHNASFESEVCL